jgi:peroxiredoxin
LGIAARTYIPNYRSAVRRNNKRHLSVVIDMKMPLTRFVKVSLILPLFVLLLIGVPATAASVGDIAPDFEIATQDGKVLRLSEFRGRMPVYVVFWNTWCSYCVKKTPRYKKLQEQFGDKIEIIAINTTWSDSPEEMQSFEEHHHINYSTAFDAGELITDRYDVFNVPTEFIVDVNGIIRYRDRVPEYLAAHIPDWLLPYVPSMNETQLVCTR